MNLRFSNRFQASSLVIAIAALGGANTAWAGGAAQQQGSSSSAADMIGMAANMAAGAMYFGVCASDPPETLWACPLGAMAMAAGAGQGGAGGKSSDSANQMAALDPSAFKAGNYNFGTAGSSAIPDLQPGGGSTSNSGGSQKSTSVLANDFAKSAMSQAQSALRNAGATLSKDGKVKFPNGAEVDLKKPLTPADMAAMGMSPGQIASALAKQDETDAKIKNSLPAIAKQLGLSADDFAAGGGTALAAGGSVPTVQGFNFKFNKNKARKPASKFAGMRRRLGNDVIGVAGDNIFEMITRRYEAQDERSEFLRN